MATVSLNKKFLSGGIDASIDLTPPETQPDVIDAFLNDHPLPFRHITLGSISAKASSGTDAIKFGDGGNQVSFSGGVGAFAGLGSSPDPGDLLSDLALEADLAKGLDLPTDPNSFYMAIRWGYDLNASAKGALALGAPVTFGASLKRNAVYAVMRRLPKQTIAKQAVAMTAKSWMLPKQVSAPGDIEPGTWLIAEIDGELAGSLGVKYGYDFNWVHEVKALGLSGDIGLSVKLGVEAALGFNIASSFGLVVGRESLDQNDSTIRLRLFRLKRKGWNFEFDAGAAIQGDFQKFLPEYDEFIKAVFGVHGGQVVSSLELVKKWTDPATSLGTLLSDQAVEFGEDFLEKVTGIDPATAFEAARNRVVEVLDKWNDLPHQVSSSIWKFIEKKVDLDDIRKLAGNIVNANEDTFNNLIASVGRDIKFLNTPAGEWLEKAAAKGLIEVLNSSQAFKRLQEVAQKTLDILDEDKLEAALKELQKYITDHLNLNSLFPGISKLQELIGVGSIQDLDQASFATLESWLKLRLSFFLDKKFADLNLDDVNKIRKSIFLFLNKAESFYEKTVKALNNKYQFDLSVKYQSTTTDTALLDMLFDFAKPNVSDSYQQALKGKYDDLLLTKRDGVNFNVGLLSHEISRNTHVEINLPWKKKEIDHINNSLVTTKVVDSDGSRLLVYELKAEDVVQLKNKRLSRLSVGGFLETPLNTTRVYDKSEITYAYTFREAKKEMKRADFLYQVKPFASEFLPVFSQSTAGGFEDWVADLDSRIDELESNGKKIFGDTLLGLSLSLPAAVGAGWLKAPPKAESGPKVPVYLDMSIRLQRKLKEIIQFYYLGNLKNFANSPLPAKTLLVYSAIPAANQISVSGNVLTMTDRDYYWDIVNQSLRRKMVLHPQTRANLEVMLDRINNLLVGVGMTDTAASFRRDQAEAIQNAVILGDKPTSGNLWSLLLTESEIIRGAREAGYELAKFTKLDDAKPSAAETALANFGSKIVNTFNANVKSVYGSEALRPLGTSLFVEAAATLDPNAAIAASKTIALLDVTVLKRDSTFNLSTFLDGEVPEEKDILIHQKIAG